MVKMKNLMAKVAIFILVLFLYGCATFYDRCGTGNYAHNFYSLIGATSGKISDKFGKPESVFTANKDKNNVQIWNYKMLCPFCENPCTGNLNIELTDGVVTRISYF